MVCKELHCAARGHAEACREDSDAEWIAKGGAGGRMRERSCVRKIASRRSCSSLSQSKIDS